MRDGCDNGAALSAAAMGKFARVAKIVLHLSAVLVVIAGAACTALALLPFDIAKGVVDRLAPDGSLDSFNPATHRWLRPCLLASGLCLLAGAGAVWLARRRLEQYLGTLVESFASGASGLAAGFCAWLQRENRWHLVAAIWVLLVAIGLRLLVLGQPMAYDEAYTFLRYASQPLHIGLSNYSTPNNHLFHTFLVHVSWKCFGTRPWAIRLPALAAGMAVIPAAYLAMRLLYNKHAALLGAALAACSPTLITYSVSARGYSIVCLTFLMLLCLATWLKKKANLAGWVCFSLLGALGLYTIPVMLYPMGAVIVWMWLSWAVKREEGDKWLMPRSLGFLALTAVVTALLYAPVVARSGLSSLVANHYVKPMPWGAAVRGFVGSFAVVWQHWHKNAPETVGFLLMLGSVGSLVVHRRVSAHRVPFVAAAGVWSVVVLLVLRVVPYDRVWLFLLPVYLGMAASAVAYVGVRLAASRGSDGTSMIAAMAVAVSAALAFHIVAARPDGFGSESMDFPEAEKAALFMKEYLRPGDAVVAACPANAPLEYYFVVHGVAVSHFDVDPRSAPRALVVVVPERRQSLKSVLEARRLPPTGWQRTEIFRRFGSAVVYDMEWTARKEPDQTSAARRRSAPRERGAAWRRAFAWWMVRNTCWGCGA